jgi:hypothetical protein
LPAYGFRATRSPEAVDDEELHSGRRSPRLTVLWRAEIQESSVVYKLEFGPFGNKICTVSEEERNWRNIDGPCVIIFSLYHQAYVKARTFVFCRPCRIDNARQTNEQRPVHARTNLLSRIPRWLREQFFEAVQDITSALLINSDALASAIRPTSWRAPGHISGTKEHS